MISLTPWTMPSWSKWMDKNEDSFYIIFILDIHIYILYRGYGRLRHVVLGCPQPVVYQTQCEALELRACADSKYRIAIWRRSLRNLGTVLRPMLTVHVNVNGDGHSRSRPRNLPIALGTGTWTGSLFLVHNSVWTRKVPLPRTDPELNEIEKKGSIESKHEGNQSESRVMQSLTRKWLLWTFCKVIVLYKPIMTCNTCKRPHHIRS